MCTASWLIAGGRLHFFFNRDELRSREAALPPTATERDGVRRLAPVDGRAGGTWLALTELGSVVALLNRSDGTRPARPTSRGEIVPRLASSGSPARLLARAERLPLDRYPPFRLVALWRRPAATLVLDWNGERLCADRLDPRLGLLASSGLGDARATDERAATWRLRHLEAGRWTPAEQRAFHREHRPRRGAWSVCVHRPEAATRSYCEATIGAREGRLRYVAGTPCAGAEPIERRLRLRTAGS